MLHVLSIGQGGETSTVPSELDESFMRKDNLKTLEAAL